MDNFDMNANPEKLQEDIEKGISATLRHAKDAVSNAKDTVIAKGKDALKSTERTIQERPLTAVLIGLGVGVVIGMLLARRSS